MTEGAIVGAGGIFDPKSGGNLPRASRGQSRDGSRVMNVAKGPDEKLILRMTTPSMTAGTGAGIRAKEFGRRRDCVGIRARRVGLRKNQKRANHQLAEAKANPRKTKWFTRHSGFVN